ncbi:MAG: phosphate ABC transporter substrate-binding protein [Chloroflexi bacterium]|nr:phosphate ABC transporter substrate-binding protein [Chloroflexota bacterium]
MNKRTKVLISLLAVGILTGSLFLGACDDKNNGEPQQRFNVSLAGSTTVQPLAEELALVFEGKNKNYNIIVGAGGSSVGISYATNGTCDIGMVSREVKQSELDGGLYAYIIAYDGIAIIVHKDLNINNLTRQQIQDIFSGAITNWQAVGGPNQTITVVCREESSGTHEAFVTLAMDGKSVTNSAILQNANGSLKMSVASTTGAIGYLSMGYLDNTVKAVNVDGVAPTIANVKNNTYTLQRPLCLVTKGQATGAAKTFIDFILSAEGQAIVAKDYIAV